MTAMEQPAVDLREPAGWRRRKNQVTTVLMWLLYAVILTGLIGALLQHFLPRELSRLGPNESTFEQIRLTQ